jgi:hypothetical protein
VFEILLRSLVSTYCVLPLNEEQSTKLDVACFITEWRASGENTLKPLTLEDLKTLLLLEIQLLLGCDVEWSVPLPQASADIDHPVLSTAGNDVTPMNPPRKAAQAALLPRLHRRGLQVRRRAAAPAVTPARIAAAAPPPPPLAPRQRTLSLLHLASST